MPKMMEGRSPGMQQGDRVSISSLAPFAKEKNTSHMDGTVKKSFLHLHSVSVRGGPPKDACWSLQSVTLDVFYLENESL